MTFHLDAPRYIFLGNMKISNRISPIHLCIFPLIFSFSGCHENQQSVPSSNDQAEISQRENETLPAVAQTMTDIVAPASEDMSSQVVFSSMADIHSVIHLVNANYKGNGQFHLNSDGAVDQAVFEESGITDISFLKTWPLEGLDLMNNPISDVRPLSGKSSLKKLFLEGTNIRDLTPLSGLQIETLYLNYSPVSNIYPLAEMPLKELNLVGTLVQDILPLARSPLQLLWLSETPVQDISPLMACPLESLTLHRTPVNDLSPLSGSSIQRLHIAESNVTDLTPVLTMKLTRFIFSPSKIKSDVNKIRNMPSLQEIGTSFDTRMSPAQFWQLMDQGDTRE